MPRSRNARRAPAREAYPHEAFAEDARARRLREEREDAARYAGPAQDQLPFAPDDAHALGGLVAMAAARQELREKLAMASRCTCAHVRDQHTGTKLVCAVTGCPCVRFRR